VDGHFASHELALDARSSVFETLSYRQLTNRKSHDVELGLSNPIVFNSILPTANNLRSFLNHPTRVKDSRYFLTDSSHFSASDSGQKSEPQRLVPETFAIPVTASNQRLGSLTLTARAPCKNGKRCTDMHIMPVRTLRATQLFEFTTSKHETILFRRNKTSDELSGQ
jgi:hypothetical protein